jgi:dihydrofolate reductase
LSDVRLSLIAAVARNGVIGSGQGLPWRLPADMQRFKRLTMGKPVIMGRKTFQSIGKPLVGRVNIVITRQGETLPEGVKYAPSLDTAISIAGEEAARSGAGEVMVIGGGEIYAAAIGRADRLYITHVDASPRGDAHFPPIDPAIWNPVSSEQHPAGERDSEATTFVVYERTEAAAGLDRG